MEHTYASLLDSIRPLSLLHENPTQLPTTTTRLPLPSELELQSIWFNGQLGRDFITTCGKQVTIRQFGFWNRSAGPDFLHASITINGEELSGPLEIDTQSSDWESHGHDTNPHFDDTILHVIFRESEKGNTHFTRTSNHREVLKVVIPESVIQAALQAPIYSSAPAHLGRCYQPLAHTSLLRVNQLLEQAARHRCQVKARRLNAIKEAHGSDQALWIALAETLGYRPNKLQMTVLAQRLPIKQLRKQANLAAIIFGTAGFLHPDIHTKAPPESQLWLEELWKDWWKVRSHYELNNERTINWTLHGNRPINHPQRRLATLTAIANQWSTFKKLSTNTTGLTEWLTTLKEPHWQHHYTLTSKASEKKLALIGKDRIHEFTINHLLPLQINEKTTAISAWQAYLKIPAPAINEKVKRAHFRLFGARKDAKQFLKKAWQHQALIQIYQDFCLADTSDCANCPFPEQLAQF